MFTHADPLTLGNPFTLIGKEKLILTAGTPDSWNGMTASWGTMGVLWNKNVLSAVIRPQRYTYEFFEREEFFTATVLKSEFENAYRIFGTKSGRDCNKADCSGLTPCFEGKAITFEQAKIAVLCKKIYVQDLDPKGFLDESIASHYPLNDYHRLYCGEIVDVLRFK